MNEQDRDFQPPAELPQPQVESNSTPGEGIGTDKVGEQEQSQAVERGASTSSLASQSPIAVPPIAPLADMSQAGTIPGSQAPASDTYTLIADDVDLIEKEWVSKAKAIVEQTKADPHNQNKEMNKVKADYMRKRYNKELKLAED